MVNQAKPKTSGFNLFTYWRADAFSRPSRLGVFQAAGDGAVKVTRNAAIPCSMPYKLRLRVSWRDLPCHQPAATIADWMFEETGAKGRI